MTEPTFASDFPPATREAWLALVEKTLKGKPVESLNARTYDGLTIEPLKTRVEEARPIQARAPGAPWTIVQRVDHPDPGEANRLALQDLENGAAGLALVLRGAPSAYGFGLAIGDQDSLARALDGVHVGLIDLAIEAGGDGRGAAALLVALLERGGIDLSTLRLSLGLDPLGAFAAMGKLSASWDEVARRCADTAEALTRRGLAGPIFLADGRPYHAAGAGEAQELASVLATALAYLRALDEGGLAPETATRHIAFKLVADADLALTISKFRALRLLWERIESEIGLPPRPVRVEAETAWRMLTRRDPWVNLLRNTVAVFAAGVGGADAVAALPFTQALGLPDAFARRLARNTQLILIEESNTHRVADPAAGSGSFEDLTEQMAGKAWDLFRDIERQGGMAEALAAGTVQHWIAATRAERMKRIATRREALTGTSEFPLLSEAPVAVLEAVPPPKEAFTRTLSLPPAGGGRQFDALVTAAREGARLADMGAVSVASGGISADPLPSARLAEPFERLRDGADAQFLRTGERPRIFLADLGPVAAFTARATFAKALFEAGGIEAPLNEGFATAEAAADAFKESGARLACLCSSDALYESLAEDAARALKRAGCERLYLAGRPGERETALRAAGVDGFVFSGCDALATLEEVHRSLGLSAEE